MGPKFLAWILLVRDLVLDQDLVLDFGLVAARALATYLIPGCVGRGVRLGSEGSSVGGGGDGVWKFGVHKMEKIKIIKIQIRSDQNVGKVWISRKKCSWPYLGPSEAIFP